MHPPENKQPFVELPVSSLLTRYTLLAVFPLITGTLLSICERVIVGQLMGVRQLAIVSSLVPVMMLNTSAMTLISSGVGISMSRQLSHQNQIETILLMRQSLRASLLVSLSMMGVVVATSHLACVLFALPLSWTAEAEGYLMISALSFPFLAIVSSLSCAARPHGRPQVLCVLSSVQLTSYLIVVFVTCGLMRLGLIGLAIATVSSAAITALVTLLDASAYSLFRKPVAPPDSTKRRVLWESVRLGIPAFSSSLVPIFMLAVLNVVLGSSWGPTGVALLGAISTLLSVALLPTNACLLGIGPIVVQNHWQNRSHRLRDLQRLSLVFGLLTVLPWYLLAELRPDCLLSLVSQGLITSDLQSRVQVQIMMCYLLLAPFSLVTATFLQATGRVAEATLLVTGRGGVLLILGAMCLPEIAGDLTLALVFPGSELLAFLLSIGVQVRKPLVLGTSPVREGRK